MLSDLKHRGVNFLATTDLAVIPEELTTNKLVILHSDLEQNEVIAKWKTFYQLLHTSFLEKMVKE